MTSLARQTLEGIGSAALVFVTAGTVFAEAAPQPGYLSVLPDVSAIVPPPPQRGDPRFEADRRVFRLTRRLLSTDRGRLAVADVPYNVPDLLHDFSCAAEINLSPQTTPATYRLITNADADTARANEVAKQRWKHLRPFQIDHGPICESRELLARSYDYPSGHTTHGWTVGLILADLLPDRATPLLARSRAYGESRIVCGAHNLSAVEAGMMSATVGLQKVRQSPAYAADFAAASAELARLRAQSGVRPPSVVCSTEQHLVETSILVSVGR
jgi:acid phosphatase (class A)